MQGGGGRERGGGGGKKVICGTMKPNFVPPTVSFPVQRHPDVFFHVLWS